VRIAILASHDGTTLQAVVDACAAGTIECQVVAVVSNNLESGALRRARTAGRILNTHPALLPKFGGKGMYGLHVHRAVLSAGEATTGASVHLVTEEYDAGAVIAQCGVSIEPADTPETLAERVPVRERELLVEVLGRIADGRLALSR
jgi:phosphoribosylglycinamide formyltransferase 1